MFLSPIFGSFAHLASFFCFPLVLYCPHQAADELYIISATQGQQASSSITWKEGPLLPASKQPTSSISTTQRQLATPSPGRKDCLAAHRPRCMAALLCVHGRCDVHGNVRHHREGGAAALGHGRSSTAVPT